MDRTRKILLSELAGSCLLTVLLFAMFETGLLLPGGWAGADSGCADVVVGEAMLSFVLADAVCTMFHADTMTDLMASLAAYRARIDSRWQDV